MKNMNKKIIAPVSVDLGAKNTAVYRTIYEEGACLSEVAKNGRGNFLTLDNNSYTFLLRERTQNRHTRRNYDRRQMAKRLLAVILKEEFQFPVEQHTQAIGFFMNRRGYNRLEDEFDRDLLDDNCLPDKFKKEYFPEGIKDKISEIFDNNNEEEVKNIVKGITEETEKINEKKNEIEINKVKGSIKKFIRECRQDIDGVSGSNKIKISSWICRKIPELKDIPNDYINKKKYDVSQYITDKIKINDEELINNLEKLTETKTSALTEEEKEWEFDPSKEPNIKDDSLGEPVIKEEKGKDSKFHYLCHHLWKRKDELDSGHRHRRKFFEEIEKDIEESKHEYIKSFALELDKHTSLNKDKLVKLIAHISNLELKVLRAYFNDKIHKAKDQWRPDSLYDIFDKWIRFSWRIDRQNKKEDDNYKELKKQWKERNNQSKNIIAFWLNTDSELTIPPYQRMTNRHPPKCQTLVLNIDYLNNKYPEWKNWLNALSESENNIKDKYIEGLRSVVKQKRGRQRQQSSEENLITAEQADLRALQFFLDRTKISDKNKINEIWSYQNKLKQQNRDNAEPTEKAETEAKFKEALNGSQLPDNLKSQIKPQICEQASRSFGSFIAKYYKSRRKARDGRYFIHEATKDVKEKIPPPPSLLQLCPHRPRQKKHQWKLDLCNIFNVLHNIKGDLLFPDPEDKEKAIIEEKIDRLKPHCKKCAEAQKKYKNALKQKLEYAKKEKAKGDKLAKDDKDLIHLDEKSKEKAKEIAEILEHSETEREKYESIFSFAQIYNIMYEDRSGFSSTCPICSLDNTQRMQTDENGDAMASRLSALSVRVIDGAVRRIMDILTRRISKAIWEDIKEYLKKKVNVRIPIIVEQNRFDFEPNLNTLKGKLKGKKGEKDTFLEDAINLKKDRIKNRNTICPYSGNSTSNGEIDHIIPQSSKHGSLNDEANLIYASRDGNKQKGNKEYYISDLHCKYKDEIFENKSDEDIAQWIYNQIESGKTADTNRFSFGKYINFTHLEPEQQKAFQHALFLPPNNEEWENLRAKVINAIDNKNRTIVNGTQRYFAQCLADNLFLRACRDNIKKKYIEFDYFEPHADDISFFRKFLEEQNIRLLGNDIKDHSKTSDKPQTSQSHLIDALIAFGITAQAHQEEGGMRVTIDDINVLSVFNELFQKFQELDSDSYAEENLERKKAPDRTHRSYHRATFYAQNYLGILIKKDKDKIACKTGFSWENSIDIDLQKKINLFWGALEFRKKRKNEDEEDHWRSVLETPNTPKDLGELYELLPKKNGIIHILWDKQKIHRYMIDEYSIASGKDWDDVLKWIIKELAYRTEHKKIEEDKEKNIKIVEKDFLIKGKITLPARKNWEKLNKDWEREKIENAKTPFIDFLKRKHSPQSEHQHQKARKVFSLPIITGEGKYLLKRNSWQNQEILQIVNDSDSRKDNNKLSRYVIKQDKPLPRLVKVINKSFARSKKTSSILGGTDKNHLLKNTESIKEISNDWLDISEQLRKNNNLPKNISTVKYKIDNTARHKIRITINKGENIKNCLNDITDNENYKTYLAPRDEKEKEKVIEQNKKPHIEYSGSSLTRAIKDIYIEAYNQKHMNETSDN